jgi:dipeptidyl aminopeptidase/acylaminoacyl peptidase
MPRTSFSRSIALLSLLASVSACALACVGACALAACGGSDAPAPALRPAPPPPPKPTSAEPAPAEPAPPAEPAQPATHEPTVLTEEQKRRDQELAPKAGAIVDAFASWGARLSKDRKRVLFSSLRDGNREIYLGLTDRPAEAPRAMTTGPERATWASFTRDEKYVLFLRDQGADEYFRVYRMDPDGSNLTNITPRERWSRDEPLLPLRKPGIIVYSAHKVVEPTSMLVVQNVEGGNPKTVYTDPLPAYAVDVTADAKRALVLREVSVSETVVVEVDLGSGKAKRIYPAEGAKAAVAEAAYSADGRRVFVATDEGGETSSVLALDPATGKVVAQLKQESPPGAPIDDIEVSPRGDRLALRINAGSSSEIRIVDAKTLALQGKVKTPPGAVRPGPFSEDGKSLTITQSTPDHPNDIFVADAATGEVKPLRDDKRPGLSQLSPITVAIEKVAAFDGLTIPVHVYLPKLDAPRRLPTVVMLHGGPSSNVQVGWSAFVRFYTAQGFAVVEPNIRGSTGYGRAYEMADNREKRGDALKDVETVNRWARSQPWCDADRLVVHGASYGGYLTLMALTRQPTLWRAGVDLVGIADLKTFLRATDQGIRSAFIEEFGDLERDAALLEAWSPSRDFDKIVAPLFVYQGQNDPRVPRAESDLIVRTLRERKIASEYMVALDEGHSMDRRENKIEFMTRVARFLSDELKLASPAR